MSEDIIIIVPVVIILGAVGGQTKESSGSARADHGIESHKTAPPTVVRGPTTNVLSAEPTHQSVPCHC